MFRLASVVEFFGLFLTSWEPHLGAIFVFYINTIWSLSLPRLTRFMCFRLWPLLDYALSDAIWLLRLKLINKLTFQIIGTFGGLGAAGLSASLLTSVLPSTLEDLLALGLCSTGGYCIFFSFTLRKC